MSSGINDASTCFCVFGDDDIRSIQDAAVCACACACEHMMCACVYPETTIRHMKQQRKRMT
eukprot:5430286-Pleurochrysis_carterae.AAC.1